MAVAKKRARKTPPPAPLRIHSLSLTEKDASALASLARSCSDRLGRTISHSAVLRAMIHLADTDTVNLSSLVETVEEELKAGRRWGKRPH